MPERFRAGHAALLAAGAALWANVHASFFLAPAIALIYAAAHLVRPLLWDLDRAAEWHKARWLAAAAAVASLASLANPYGWRLHRHVFPYLTDTRLISRIGEFQSFDFHADGAGQIIAALLIAMLGGALALAGRRPGGFRAHGRGRRLERCVRRGRCRWWRSCCCRWPIARSPSGCARRRVCAPECAGRIDGFLAYSDNLRRLDARGCGWAIAWTVPAAALGRAADTRLSPPGRAFRGTSFRWRRTRKWSIYRGMRACSLRISSADT